MKGGTGTVCASGAAAASIPPALGKFGGDTDGVKENWTKKVEKRQRWKGGRRDRPPRITHSDGSALHGIGHDARI